MGDINLTLSGLDRNIGNPLTVGRECRRQIPELRVDQREGLPVSSKGNYPSRCPFKGYASRNVRVSELRA
jgi:hypothetical protein